MSLERIDLNLSRPSDVRRPFPVYNCLVNKEGPKLKSFSQAPPDCNSHNGPRPSSKSNKGKTPLLVTFWKKEFIPSPLNVTVCRTLKVTMKGYSNFWGKKSLQTVKSWQKSVKYDCLYVISGGMAKEAESIIAGSAQYGSIVPEYNWLRHQTATATVFFVFNDTTTMDLR